MAYKLKSHKMKILWNLFLIILRIFLPFISYFFFGQIFSFLTSVFYCRKEESYESPYLQCLEGLWIYSLFPAAIIALIFQLIIGFITNSLYYRPMFNNNISDIIKKTNSFPDIIFMLTKSIIILLFISDKGLESEHWAMLSFLILITGINAYYTLSFQNRKNAILMSLNNIFSLITFFGYLTLFIGKILKIFEFDGLIYLFIFDIIIIFIYSFFYKINERNIANINFKNINNSYEYLNYIYKYYMIIKKSNNERSYLILLRSLVSKIEEKCHNYECPLNKYLDNLKKGIESKFNLYQFCDYLFQYGISKFNDNIEMKNNYSYFLVVEMNDKKKASMILNNIKNHLISIQMNYNIYRCKNLIDKFNINNNNNDNYLVFKYSKDFHILKNLISKMTLLQYEFFSLILKSKIKKNDNFKKIFKIGSKIIKYNKKIKEIYNELKKAKTYNVELIDLYSEFVEKILEDEEKYQECQDIKKVIYINNVNIMEKNFSNFDINIFKEKDITPYLVISADFKNLGIIKDCSLSLSKIFNYQKEELIGEHLNILIPEIFHKPHNLILTQQSEKNRIKLFENLFENKLYSPHLLEIDGYGISKSKFLIPIKFDIYLVKTEENELIYVVEIYKKMQINEEDNNDIRCCVLTDTNFLIQSFTPNSIFHLKINYDHINRNYEIINSIKQFQEDYLIDINATHLNKNCSIKESSIITHKKMKKSLKASSIVKSIKTDILNKNYSQKCKITWVIDEDTNINYIKTRKKSFYKRKSLSNDFSVKISENKEKDMFMEIKKIILNKELIGYYFYFSEIKKRKKPYLNKYSFKKLEVHHYFENYPNKYQQAQTINASNSFKENNEFRNNRKRRNSFDKDKKVNFKNEYEEYFDDEKNFISANFISKSTCNFIFNPIKLTYIFSNKMDDGHMLNETLKKEVNTKIKKLQFQKNSLIYRKQNLSSSNQKSDSEGGEESSSLSSGSESESINKKGTNIESPGEKGKEENIQSNNNINIKEEQNSIKNNDKQSEIKNKDIKKKNDFSNDYYKIDFSKIKFLIFDFYKEIFIEGDKNEKMSKVEIVLSKLKKDIYTNNMNKEHYPYITLQNKKQNKKKIEKKENNIQKDLLFNEEKLLEKKIFSSLRNKKDETPIKNFKIFSLIYFITMFILLLICIHYYLFFYSKIKGLLNLLKNAINIKYCDRISVFYIGESTLLNFNASKIEGGIFYNFPADPNNKKGYINLMREKIKESFLENEISLQELLTSKIELTKNTSKYLSETTLNTDYIFSSGKIEIISADIFTTLMQYNGAFYNLASSPKDLEQNHTDILNFLHNSFNDYARGINILISLYSNELEIQVNNIKQIWIIGLVLFFIIYLILYIFILIHLISTSKKKANYIEIIYGIDDNILKMLITKCENFHKKINNLDSKNLNDREDLVENFREKKCYYKELKNTKKKSIFIPRNKIPSEPLKLKKKLPDNILGFMRKYGIFLLISFSYYIFNTINLLKIGENAILISQYFYRTQNLYTKIIDMFIAYRQYIFDDSIIIYNMLPFDYLEKIENNSYSTLFEDAQFSKEFVQKFLADNEELQNMLKKSFCSYNFTNKFISIEDCQNKLGQIINYDFSIVSAHFIDELRINKYLVKYLLSTGTVRGSLNDYDPNIWYKDPTIPKKGENKTGENIFRLDLYNNQTIHAYLDLIFVNLILPYIDINRKYILPNISINDKIFYLYLTSVFYLIFVILIYFVYLLLKIRFINKNIYKTKNMLTLIPINILVSQKNIKILLNLAKKKD